MNTNLANALHKAHRRDNGAIEWCGCFTPAEIMELIGIGAVPAHSENMLYIKQSMRDGDCRPQWFYFFLSPKLKEALGKRYDKEGNPHSKTGS